uniref:Putative common plant regulatory factor 1 isoform X3 n=1 Tax=Davidia involucrata TaxID=16924 RepID=A0A5B6YJ36_DAVIN
MASKEDRTSPKSEKASPSEQEQTNIHLYPDWAAIQPYYGPGVPLPPPYFNFAVTAGHFPHPHMWTPQQSLMPPYGVPYSTVYSHGVVYAHPAVPLVAAPVSTELHSKSSDDMDQGLTKKLKRSDGLAVPVGNGGSEVDAEGSVHEVSQSDERDIDASSDGSDGNTGAHQSQRKSNSMALSTDNDVKIHIQASPLLEGEANVTSGRVSGITVVPENVTGKSVESPIGKIEASAACAASTAGAGLPFEVWVQDERQLKRERRKQANRESARKSRLRKQAETEELMMRYESLKVENLTLKSEINQLTKESDKVRRENAALMEMLSDAQLGQPRETVPDQIGYNMDQPHSTDELCKLTKLDSVSRSEDEECKTLGTSSSKVKLKIFESSADTVPKS